MQNSIKRVQIAIEAFKRGEMVILVDDPDRENEGDLILPAECATPESMNFMIRQGTGIVCLAMAEQYIAQLDLPLMLHEEHNSSARGTPFTLSIDAKVGITTGVSAYDRTITVLKAMQENATADDFVKPGHIFPLKAKALGVLERQGHTEGASDLAQIAGFKAAAIICEIMNPDGTMAKGKELNAFAQMHELHMLTIEDIIAYRKRFEDFIIDEATCIAPLADYGHFQVKSIRSKLDHNEHVVFYKENQTEQPLLVRVHSSCMTGDVFASQRCDCHAQLHYSLKRISEEGGMLIYLQQEGRGIGLFNKIKAYALQDAGLDTVEANEKLGFPSDSRHYEIAANILRNMHINAIRLLTNNPAKIAELTDYGIDKVVRVAMPPFHNDHNQFYLQTKKQKFKHVINFD